MIRPLLEPALLIVLAVTTLCLVVGGAALSRPPDRRAWVLRGLMVLVLAAALLRPGVGTAPVATQPAELEVLLVVDRTTSMSARDWNGRLPRLAGVERDAAALAATLPSARFTIMSFGKRVALNLPSTNDRTLLSEVMAGVERENFLSGKGSSIDRPLDEVEELLRRQDQQHPQRRRIVVLMTDGENTSPKRQQSFAPLETLTDAALVLGYGTRRHGLMPVDEDDLGKGWIQDPATQAPAVSRLDEENLRKVTAELGGTYLHRRAPGGLDEVTSDWMQEFVDVVEEPGGERPAERELTWVLGLVLLGLALIDLRSHWRRFAQARRDIA